MMFGCSLIMLAQSGDGMSWLDAAILGVVEGITEYLPISSTGHLIIASSLLGLDRPPEQKAAVDAFLIVMQGGAILAVLGLYWQRVIQMIAGLFGKNAPGLKLFINLCIAFMPAAVLGVLLDDWIESKLFYPIPVMSALALGGLVMIGLGPWQRKFFHERPNHEFQDAHSFTDIEHLSWKRALVIGLLQCVAMWPGTSRSMMTIVGGMLVGMKPRHAAEFSFLLGLPTLGGACVYKGLKNLTGDAPNMFQVIDPISLVIGVAVATASAAIAIKWLVGYLARHGVAIFGWYRLVLCGVLATLLSLGVVSFDAGDDGGVDTGRSFTPDVASAQVP